MFLMFTPPDLPAYLANTFELKPVLGVPTNDEVKNIHAVIRAAEIASQIPAWNDPDLSMELAQHLFDIQTARYRDKYPVNVFPSTNTYAPPTLPSHIAVTLEPVIGAPSDDEVKLVHTALRTSENLANFPSMFDPDLSMNLSQHLFDIQFARHIQRTTEGYFTPRQALPSTRAGQTARVTRPRVPVDQVLDIQPGITLGALQTELDPEPEHGGDTVEAPIPDLFGRRPGIDILPEDARGIIEQLRANQDQSDRTLKDGLKDVVENVTRLMIKLHNHSARGFNSGNADWNYHHVVNGDGEACEAAVPWAKNAPGHKLWREGSEETLARYLQFYNIGTELIEPGDPPALKPDSKEQATMILGKLTHTRVE
ncbi:hypothetical protein BDV93DRAFT_612023 [Ceratobasidium sp. AG-I]|nr:hypothetical protein BDV93DRAFT_612023 [Ceratobasidium sp. AG-I]